jgi:uncharacterized protein with von Willebrand factor type A (vWA) domain
VSPVEAIDARRAAVAATLERRGDLRAALRAVIVKDEAQRDAFDRTFDAFFDVRLGAGVPLREIEGGVPLGEDELAALLRAIDAAQQASGGASAGGLSAVALGGAALDRALRDAAQAAGVADMQSGMQTGYFTQRVLEAVGIDAMRDALPDVRARLALSLSEERARAIARALEGRIDLLRGQARALVGAELGRRTALAREQFRRRVLEEKRFTDLRPEDVRAVEREVRRLAERLRGRLSVRRKRRRRGKLDVRRTLRAAHRTGGVPFRTVARRRREDRPKLVVLCDISDSVRFSVRFLLMLTWAVQEVFRRTRTFAFVSELGETTELFEKHSVERATELVYAGAALRVTAGSDYGTALGLFDARFHDAVDKKTTVVIVGDARTNYLDPNTSALERIARRSARLLWLNPEPRSSWGFGDSEMDHYLPHIDEALPVSDLGTLRAAVDRLVKPR